MKILQIAPAWIPTPPQNYGGTEWVVSNLTEGLIKLGHDVTLFATGNSHTSANLEYVFNKGLSEMGILWASALPVMIHYHEAFKLSSQFDVVHAHLSSDTDPIIMPYLADLYDQGIPAIMTIHSHWPFDKKSGMDPYFIKYYASKITAVNISKAETKLLPQGFRSGGFVYNSLNLDSLKFNTKGGKYLTWLGKILPHKGLYESILVAKEAGEQIIFAGVIDKDKYAVKSQEYFDTKIKPLIDGDQVQFLGPADLKLKNKLLGGAKGFINAIQWDEPFGMVMAESMACGTPVIVLNRGAAPELVKDGETGFVVNSLPEMVKAVKKLDQINRTDCRKHVEELFSAVTAAKGYLVKYQETIQRTKKLARPTTSLLNGRLKEALA